MDNKIIHRRLVSNTPPLFEELEKLGYKEIESTGRGFNQVRRFQNENKLVYTSYDSLSLIEKINVGKEKKDHKGLKLQEIKDKERIHYTGLTIHDEMLKFFTKRTPQEIKVNE